MIENKDVSQVLTEGLLAGFAGNGDIKTVNRIGFQGKSSDYLTQKQGIYHDEWFVPDYIGGGQELIETGDGTQFTRLYGGGTPDPKILEDLGITVEDVGAYLIKMLTTLGNKTRLFEDYVGEVEGENLDGGSGSGLVSASKRVAVAGVKSVVARIQAEVLLVRCQELVVAGKIARVATNDAAAQRFDFFIGMQAGACLGLHLGGRRVQ